MGPSVLIPFLPITVAAASSSALIGLFTTGSQTITASCTNPSAEYTTWDNTAGCLWHVPASGLTSHPVTSVSRGISCISTPGATHYGLVVLSIAEGDSVHLFTSVTTSTMMCPGAGCGTVKIKDYADSEEAEMATLVTCLEDIRLTDLAKGETTAEVVLYRNQTDLTDTATPTITSSAPQETSPSAPASSSNPTSTTIPATPLPPSAIAGISIGILLSIITISTFLLFLCRSRHQNRHPLPPSSTLTTASPPPPWPQWTTTSSTQPPTELPQTSVVPELLGNTTHPCELDATSIAPSATLQYHQHHHRPVSSLSRRSAEIRRYHAFGGEMDGGTGHPYQFYSPWSVGDDLEIEVIGQEGQREEEGGASRKTSRGGSVGTEKRGMPSAILEDSRQGGRLDAERGKPLKTMTEDGGSNKQVQEKTGGTSS